MEVWLSTGKGPETYCGSSPAIDLPTGYFFGVTATTGHLADNHEVYFMQVTPAPGAHVTRDDGPQQVHRAHDPQKEAEQKEYWRAKTPEEKALEQERERLAAEAQQKEVCETGQQANNGRSGKRRRRSRSFVKFLCVSSRHMNMKKTNIFFFLNIYHHSHS